MTIKNDLMMATLGYNRPLVRKQCKALAARLGCEITTHRRYRNVYYTVHGPTAVYGWNDELTARKRSLPPQAAWSCYDWREVMVALEKYELDLWLHAHGCNEAATASIKTYAPEAMLRKWFVDQDDYYRLMLADWFQDNDAVCNGQGDALAALLRAATPPATARPAAEDAAAVAARRAVKDGKPARKRTPRKPRTPKAGPA